jgi:hypothetical protein
MNESTRTAPVEHPLRHILKRKNVLAGLMFIAVAALGLWMSRNYPVGTALRMSTGYVPRLLCWILIGLGAVILFQGVRQAEPPASEPIAGAAPSETGMLARLRPIAAVTVSLIAFALVLERLGLVLAIFLLVGIASLATRQLKAWEVLAAGAGLSVLSWVIFVFGLGLPIPVWPDW